MDTKSLISQAEAGRLLGLTRSRVGQLIQEGKLVTITIAGRPLVVAQSLQQFIHSRKASANKE